MKARTILIMASVALLWSCTQDGGTIYKTIESEKKVTDSTLPKTLTVHEMLTTGIGNPYFVAAGAIYNGTVLDAAGKIGWPTTDKTAVAVDAPVSGALCNALAYDGAELWGGFFTPGANLGLYRSTSRSFLSVAAVQDIAIKDKQVTMLQFVNGKLFVGAATVPVGGTAYVYELDYYNGTTWSPAPLISGLAKPINGVAWDGSSYLMVAGSALYTGTSADPPVFDAGTSALSSLTVSASDELRGVFAQTAPSRVIIASKLGLYVRDAGTWSQAAPDPISGVTVPFLTAAGPSDAGGNIYLAGSDGYGYYYLDWSATPKTLTRFDTSTISLYNAAVRRILVDGTTVFMGTSGAGLWRGTFDSSGKLPAANAWVHE
jgi:hypothetical protein